MVLELMAVEVESLSGRRLVGCFSVGFPRAGTTWTTSSGSWKCPTSTRSCDGGACPRSHHQNQAAEEG